MKYFIVILFLLTFSSSIFAAKDEKYFHVFGGVGELFSPSTYRAGTSRWEAGLLNRRSFGIMAMDYHNNFYSGIGGIFNQNGAPGLFAALGYEFPFWSIFTLRGEANIGHGIDNFSQSEIILGLSLYW